jgi:hypothetical protein
MCINFFSFFILSSVFSLLSPLFFFFLFLSVSLSLCAALSPVMVVGWWFVFGFAGRFDPWLQTKWVVVGLGLPAWVWI